jgi:hypothetical protein
MGSYGDPRDDIPLREVASRQGTEISSSQQPSRLTIDSARENGESGRTNLNFAHVRRGVGVQSRGLGDTEKGVSG